jgi:Reverse transcriptase (RNA-dependent DNA polymerase)
MEFQRRLIKKFYTGMTVNVRLGKEKASIPYTIGVQQGDNMAPLLFIFVMRVFTDNIEKNWSTKWGLQTIQMNHFPNIGRGRPHSAKSTGTQFDLTHLLYVDDGTFLFNSWEDIEKRSQMVYDTIKLLGLTLYVGRGETKSKSEAMYVSPSILEDNATNINTNKISLNEGSILFCKEFE